MDIDPQASANSEKVLFGKLEPGIVKIDPEIAMVFIILVLCGCRRRQYRKAQHQRTQYR